MFSQFCRAQVCLVAPFVLILAAPAVIGAAAVTAPAPHPGLAPAPLDAGAAARHREAALPAVTGEHYEGGPWLGTFAVYLTSGAGLR